MGLMTYNNDWKAIQERFLPSKSMHQVKCNRTAFPCRKMNCLSINIDACVHLGVTKSEFVNLNAVNSIHDLLDCSLTFISI